MGDESFSGNPIHVIGISQGRIKTPVVARISCAEYSAIATEAAGGSIGGNLNGAPPPGVEAASLSMLNGMKVRTATFD